MRRWLVAMLLGAAGCAPAAETIPAVPAGVPPVRGVKAEDTAPREEYRLVPPEAYLRTYLQLFGGVTPIEAQRRARTGDGGALFDSWNDYVSALGFADYKLDIPRASQTNALMIATLEKLGIALCDRAVEHDLRGAGKKPPPPVPERQIFAFDVSADLDEGGFAPRFDVLHRTFLGYPAALAPPDRASRFFALYKGVVVRHSAPEFAKERLSPVEAGWANVCYGLLRHPEFQLY